MTEPNFEAIGRYQHASKQVSDLTQQRLSILLDIKHWTERCATWARQGAEFYDLKTEPCRARLDQLSDINSKLAAAVTECNIWAEPAQASRIRLMRMD
ncbi:MAG: hypothetical protein LBI48_04470 [Burkholderiaceae bacterium]|jgi:hypothetical protein|nr:hypothetical protein [Burkholderiaceae bacterium]